MLKKNLSKIGAYVGTLPVLLLPLSVSAALSDNTTYLGQVQSGGAATAGQAELPKLIGQLISVILGILGIILVVYIVQAGIMYMTAGGDTDKVKKAKTMITQAVIGMIIIVAAYSISSFVITQLTTIAK